MILQVDEAAAEHSPHVGSVVLDVVDSANVVDANLLLLRCFEDDYNVELDEEFGVLLSENSGVGFDIDHRIQCLGTSERCFSAVLADLVARHEELRREVEFADRLGIQESYRLHAGQDDVFGDLSA